jgi:hypothetical protein
VGFFLKDGIALLHRTEEVDPFFEVICAQLRMRMLLRRGRSRSCTKDVRVHPQTRGAEGVQNATPPAPAPAPIRLAPRARPNRQPVSGLGAWRCGGWILGVVSFQYARKCSAAPCTPRSSVPDRSGCLTFMAAHPVAPPAPLHCTRPEDGGRAHACGSATAGVCRCAFLSYSYYSAAA